MMSSMSADSEIERWFFLKKFSTDSMSDDSIAEKIRNGNGNGNESDYYY